MSENLSIDLSESELRALLDSEAARINSPAFIADDPVQFPRRFTSLPDVEIAALLASTIAWGNRRMICRDCDRMLALLDNQPLAYTLDQPLLLPSLTLAVNVPEPVCFVAPAGHPLADKAEVPLDVLAQQEFLLTERGMSYRDALDQRLAARGLSIHPYIELGSASLLCQMVERGMGLSFLPEYIVRPVLSSGRIARLHVPDCTVTMHRQLFYHKDKWLTPQMKAFIELVNQ